MTQVISLRGSMNIPNIYCRIDKKIFFLFMVFLLPAFCYGKFSNHSTIMLRVGEMAHLPIKLNTTTTTRLNHILITRQNHSGLKEKVLDCVWIGDEVQPQQNHLRFSLDVNDSRSLIILKINQTSKSDSGIYEGFDVSNKYVIFKLNVTVQDADHLTSEGSNQNVFQSTLTLLNPLLKNDSGNVGWEHSYKYRIPVILGALVLLVPLVVILVYLIKRHEKFQQCKCFHTEKKKETVESLETKTELLSKDTKTETMDILEKVDDSDINLQERDNYLRIIIETKPRSEEQHQLRRENNRTETSASAGTHMIVDERMDLGENVNLRNKTRACNRHQFLEYCCIHFYKA